MKNLKLKLNKLGMSGLGNVLIPRIELEKHGLEFGKEYYVTLTEEPLHDQPIHSIPEPKDIDSHTEILLELQALRLELFGKQMQVAKLNDEHSISFKEWLLWSPKKKPKMPKVEPPKKTVSIPEPKPTPAPLPPMNEIGLRFKTKAEAEKYYKENSYLYDNQA